MNREPNALDALAYVGMKTAEYGSYISRYARISEDGQIITSANHRLTSYGAAVIGHGSIKNPKTGRSIGFRSEKAAARAAIKVWRKLQEAKK